MRALWSSAVVATSAKPSRRSRGTTSVLIWTSRARLRRSASAGSTWGSNEPPGSIFRSLWNDDYPTPRSGTRRPDVVSNSERMRTTLRHFTSWLVLALGCGLGLLACVGLGLDPILASYRSPASYPEWSGAIGAACLGLACLIGSLAALRNRKLAGVIFLAIMP